MSFFNTAIRKKDVFMALPYYRGPALEGCVFYALFCYGDRPARPVPFHIIAKLFGNETKGNERS